MSIHIIPAVFTSLRSVTTERREQWSYGQVLQISGDIELPETFEAHFCCDGDNTTITQIGQNGAVEVPPEYMETGRTVLCYIFLHDASTDGRTMYTIRIPILRRPRPTDLEPTPVQQDAITQAIGAMQAARADIESIAEDARQAIDDAIEDAIEEAKESGDFKGDKGDPGDPGQDGQDGHSPVVTASKSGTVTTVYVDGTQIAQINDGSDGSDGQDGQDGADGRSPVVTASKTGTVTTISVDGTAVAQINDGADGATPIKGTDYWTAQDKAGIVQDVLNALPTAQGVSF